MRDLSSSGNPGEALSLHHRDYLESQLARLDCELSEYCFSNLYLFRIVHRYRLYREPIPHLLGVTYDGVSHAMPLAPIGFWDPRALLSRVDCLYPIADRTARAAMARFGMEAKFKEQDSDYLYDAQRLARLSGATLRQKRKEADIFAVAHRPVCVPLDRGTIGAALAVLDLWTVQRGVGRGGADVEVCREALLELDLLGLSGIVISDAIGQPCGFLLYEWIQSDGVVVHFAKGDCQRPGVYPYMFSSLAANSKAKWLNFEQDLGKPGLRQAKRALNPKCTLRKFRMMFPTILTEAK